MCHPAFGRRGQTFNRRTILIMTNPLRDTLLSQKLETRQIQIIGFNVICRELMPREVTEFFNRNKESPAKATIYLAIIGAVDTNGDPIFTADDELQVEDAAMEQLPFKRKNQLVEAVNQIAETILDLTGLAGTPAEKKPAEPPIENDSPPTIGS
jgi:hypothetical protein